MPSFYELLKMGWSCASIPIGKKEQRLKIKGRILKLMKKKEVVRCFRDAPGYLIVAHRRKNLDDYFKG